jgi:hypothetical protein
MVNAVRVLYSIRPNGFPVRHTQHSRETVFIHFCFLLYRKLLFLSVLCCSLSCIFLYISPCIVYSTTYIESIVRLPSTHMSMMKWFRPYSSRTFPILNVIKGIGDSRSKCTCGYRIACRRSLSLFYPQQTQEGIVHSNV